MIRQKDDSNSLIHVTPSKQQSRQINFFNSQENYDQQKQYEFENHFNQMLSFNQSIKDKIVNGLSKIVNGLSIIKEINQYQIKISQKLNYQKNYLTKMKQVISPSIEEVSKLYCRLNAIKQIVKSLFKIVNNENSINIGEQSLIEQQQNNCIYGLMRDFEEHNKKNNDKINILSIALKEIQSKIQIISQQRQLPACVFGQIFEDVKNSINLSMNNIDLPTSTKKKIQQSPSNKIGRDISPVRRKQKGQYELIDFERKQKGQYELIDSELINSMNKDEIQTTNILRRLTNRFRSVMKIAVQSMKELIKLICKQHSQLKPLMKIKKQLKEFAQWFNQNAPNLKNLQITQTQSFANKCKEDTQKFYQEILNSIQKLSKLHNQ